MNEVNEQAPMTEEARARILAEQCADNRGNYQRFVRALASNPETYNTSIRVNECLLSALDRLAPASLELDHLKRVMTYGDKLRINPPLVTLGMVELDEPFSIQESEEQREKRLLLAHALLGMITEALELAPILQGLLVGQPIDQTNLREELGDSNWYMALAEFSMGSDLSSITAANVRKLAKRYKGGVFTSHEALNRDLDAERGELEKQ